MSCNAGGSGVFLVVLASTEAALLTVDIAFTLCISSWDTAWYSMTQSEQTPQGSWARRRTIRMFSQTFAVVQVHVDGLALTVGAESYHVFVRVERHAVESGAVTELRVDCNLVTWEDNKTDSWSQRRVLWRAARLLCYRKNKHDSHLCMCSRRTPSRPRCQRRGSSHMVWKCCRSALCSLWLHCTSSQPDWKEQMNEWHGFI